MNEPALGNDLIQIFIPGPGPGRQGERWGSATGRTPAEFYKMRHMRYIIIQCESARSTQEPALQRSPSFRGGCGGTGGGGGARKKAAEILYVGPSASASGRRPLAARSHTRTTWTSLFLLFLPPSPPPPPRPSRFSPSRTRSAFPSSEREVARTPRFQRFPYTSETATRGSPRSSKMSPSRGGRSALAGERLPRSYDGEGSYSLRDFSRADLKSDLACTFYIRRAPSLGMEARGCECRDPGGRYSKALLGVFNPRPHVGLVVRVSATCRRNISQAARAHLSRAPYRNRRICTD